MDVWGRLGTPHGDLRIRRSGVRVPPDVRRDPLLCKEASRWRCRRGEIGSRASGWFLGRFSPDRWTGPQLAGFLRDTCSHRGVWSARHQTSIGTTRACDELSVSGSRDNLETCEERVSLTCRTCDLGRRMPGLSRESTRVLQRPRRPAPSNVHVSNEGLSSAAEDDQRPKPRTSRAEIRTGLLRLSRRRVPGPRRLDA